MEDQIKKWIAAGYALEVTDAIMSSSEPDELDRESLFIEILNMAKANIESQLVFEAEPQLSEKQIESAIEESGKAAIRNTISGMVEAGLLEATFNEDGEVVYTTTAKGCAYGDMIEDGVMTTEEFNKQVKEGKI